MARRPVASDSSSEEVRHVGAANYEIRIKGRVGDSLLSAFEGMAVTIEPVETVVYGPIPDQNTLHELLAKLQSLGLEVVELRRLPGEGGHPGTTPPQRS
jgi:hypothetical protein